MADQTDISQAISEAAADSSTAQVSQAVSEVGADASTASISQAISEVGSDASTAFISQAMFEGAANASTTFISQLTIELGAAPSALPAVDSPTGTFIFDEGLGSSYYLVPQLTDSGNELRDKVVKSVKVIGKTTNGKVGIFGYGATDPISVGAIESGLANSLTNAIVVPDTTHVTPSQRFPVNCKNIALHTVMIEGRWDGTGIRDRVDELVYEVAIQGVRR